MGKQAETLMRNILEIAQGNGGLAVIETWVCPRCRQNTFAIHKMKEVISCGTCDHRVASGLPRYQRACDIAADIR